MLWFGILVLRGFSDELLLILVADLFFVTLGLILSLPLVFELVFDWMFKNCALQRVGI